MARVYNFSAGPATLPEPVLERAKGELSDWNDQGLSVMEASHRSKAFVALAERSEATLRRLLGLGGEYKVLFLQGGATLQFAGIPLNLTQPGDAADYVITGSWSKKAAKEAGEFCAVNVAADGADSGYNDIPDLDGWRLNEGSQYLHLCINETISGVELSSFWQRTPAAR